MLKKTWNEHNATADIPAAEDDLRLIMLPALMYRDGVENAERFLLPSCRESEVVRAAALDAAKEMGRILAKKEAPRNCQINHITSGKKEFVLYDTSDFKAYSYFGTYSDEASARQAAASLDDADISQMDGEWVVNAYDEDLTEHNRKYIHSGVYAGSFGTREEAELEAGQYRHYVIDEEESKDYYMVADISCQRNVFNMYFPYLLRALAFLYLHARPAAWIRFVDVFGKDERDGEGHDV